MRRWIAEFLSSNEGKVSFLTIISFCFCGLAIYQYGRYNDISDNLNEFLKWLLTLVFGNHTVTTAKNAVLGKSDTEGK